MQIQVKKNLLNLDHIISLVRQQQYMEALDRYRQCLHKKPNLLPKVLLSLYKELYRNTTNIHIKLLISELYFLQHFFSDAYIELEEIYQQDKTFSQTYFLLNKLYKKTDDTQYVVPIFHDAIKHNIFDSTIIDVLPKIYFDENNIDGSISLFKKLLEHQPENDHYYKTLAELYKIKGDYKQSVSIFTSLIEKSPQFLGEAVSALEDILSKHTNDLGVRKTLLTFYIKQCKPNESLKQLEELCQLSIDFRNNATTIYKELLDNFPAEYHIICSFINHLIQNNQFTDAIHNLEFFYTHYNDHHVFIKETLLSILAINPNHQLTILHYIDYAIRFKEFDIIKDWVDHFFTLDEIPFQELIEKLSLALKNPSIASDYFEYQTAKLYYLQQDFEKALEFCNSQQHFSLEKEKLKLTILIDKKDFDLAQKSCLMLIEKYPFEKDYYNLLKKAQTNHIDILIKTESDLKKRLILHINQADFFNAIECAQQFSPQDDNYIYSQLIICRAFFEQGRIDQALNQIERIQIPYESNQSLFCEILFCKAICYVFLNQYNKAIQHFEEILHYNINQKKVQAILTHLKRYPLTINQGETISCLINPDNRNLTVVGIQNSEELLSNPTQTMGFSTSENNTGVQYLFKQNHVSATSVFTNALQLDNRKPLVHSNMSLCHCLAEDYDKAIYAINKAISLNKNNDIYHLNKGIIYYQQDEIELSLECFQAALRLNNQNYHAIFNLAMIYYKINRLYLSFKYLEKLNQIGLYYMLLQRHFCHLNQFSKSIYYWATSSFDIIPSQFIQRNET